MKYRALSIVLLLVLLVPFRVCAINFDAETTYDSVVVVYTNTGVGSGFSIKENQILTNAHVVGNSKKVQINLYDGSTVKGTVIKTDEAKDLALIKVSKKIKPLNLKTDKLSIGQEVYAIGAPKDMPYTMTKGIVSALDRKVGYNSYTQIDASVNSGNSGGPLVDEDGNVIGVITLKATDAEGIAFAIKIKDVNDFIKGVSADAEADDGSNPSEDGEFPDEDMYESDDRVKALMLENDILKIVVCVSVFINMLAIPFCLYLLITRKKYKPKDEFDFEIEIEE